MPKYEIGHINFAIAKPGKIDLSKRYFETFRQTRPNVSNKCERTSIGRSSALKKVNIGRWHFVGQPVGFDNESCSGVRVVWAWDFSYGEKPIKYLSFPRDNISIHLWITNTNVYLYTHVFLVHYQPLPFFICIGNDMSGDTMTHSFGLNKKATDLKVHTLNINLQKFNHR